MNERWLVPDSYGIRAIRWFMCSHRSHNQLC